MRDFQIQSTDEGFAVKFNEPLTDGRALDAILSEPWMIDPMALAQIVAIAGRANASERVPALVEPTGQMSIANGVATISVNGPIFPRANLFTEISGAASLAMVETEFEAAMADDSVERIVLAMDSPGGVTSGIEAFSERVFRARGEKEIVAVAQDRALSAAYWIASAAGEFFAARTATVGSIGVILTAMRSGSSDRQIEIVSTQSPRKRMDPGTESGREALQAHVDEMAAVFVETVARNRGTDADDVLANYGQGGIVIAGGAVARGMIDGISSRQALTIDRQGGTQMTGSAKDQPAITIDHIKAEYPGICKALREEGAAEARTGFDAESIKQEAAAAERERIESVMGLADKMPEHRALVMTLALDGKTTKAEAAIELIDADQKARKGRADAIASDAPAPAAPSVDAPADPKPKSSAPVEERCKAEWDKDEDLRAEFADDFESFVAFTKADEAGNVRLLTAKTA